MAIQRVLQAVIDLPPIEDLPLPLLLVDGIKIEIILNFKGMGTTFGCETIDDAKMLILKLHQDELNRRNKGT